MTSKDSNTLNDPKVSVVCPIYNRKRLCLQTIHSILDQSFEDWELILVDDGSTDGTQEVLKAFAAKEPRIKPFFLEHTGIIGKVRNYGNQQAIGELIVVQDSDDVSLPNRLEVIWEEYKKSNADVIYHGVYNCYLFDEAPGITFRRYNPAKVFDKLRILQHQYITAHVATKRQVALNSPYDEKIKIADDWQFILELALNNYTFHKIDQCLYEYWFSDDSANIAGEKDGRRLWDVKYLMDKLRSKYNIDIKIAELTKVINGQLQKEFVRAHEPEDIAKI